MTLGKGPLALLLAGFGVFAAAGCAEQKDRPQPPAPVITDPGPGGASGGGELGSSISPSPSLSDSYEQWRRDEEAVKRMLEQERAAHAQVLQAEPPVVLVPPPMPILPPPAVVPDPPR